MTRYLLDTNIVSELRRMQPNAGVRDWYDTIPQAELVVSVLTVGEIRYGIERVRRRGDTEQADRLDEWLSTLHEHFGDRIVPVDVATAQAWGRIRTIRSIPVIDALLTATCIAHDLTLVTRNVHDVADLGARIVNPFES
ncbi:type II toxin-antitoxin system VapC family toxin [Rathayibacter soli]|uniref:type II toxin-antitoxin system VapC family toxin n=1 Tax=Rathayibacter soli TaxID=3144168 RepID=UPI0027E52DAD|nr:type II toxin-antitoxin system VapC family toxin [Glaciibacter superstes]